MKLTGRWLFISICGRKISSTYIFYRNYLHLKFSTTTCTFNYFFSEASSFTLPGNTNFGDSEHCRDSEATCPADCATVDAALHVDRTVSSKLTLSDDADPKSSVASTSIEVHRSDNVFVLRFHTTTHVNDEIMWYTSFQDALVECKVCDSLPLEHVTERKKCQ